MTDNSYCALVVDDDPAIRKLSALALKDEGFSCTTVGDGVQAMKQIHAEQFDLVVTDLAMPLKHGHSVVVELLTMPSRPVIAVLTGVAEPRLAKDLMARGVDDVIAKPVNFAIFAAKLKALVGRRQASSAGEDCVSPAVSGRQLVPIEIDDLVQRLSGMPRILPLSCAALDVYELTRNFDGDTRRIAAALERDASLLAEILHVANSAHFNHHGSKIADVEQAVLRIGQKRVGEIALATHALGAITGTLVPWMDTAIVARRSIAAGVALELLAERSRPEQEFNGLLAAAIMHALGRVVLASLYPAQYGELIKRCETTGCALSTAEAQLLPEAHTAALARLLQYWNVPAEIYEPLGAVGATYDQLASLPELARSRVELLKASILVGELAVGKWHSWDLLEFPSKAILSRLAIDDVRSCVEKVRTDLEAIAHFRSTPAAEPEAVQDVGDAPEERGRVACCDVCPTTGPLIHPVLRSFGLCLIERASDTPVIVNGIGAPAEAMRQHLALPGASPAIILSDQRKAMDLGKVADVLSFPCSYWRFQSACCHALHLGD